MFHISLGREQQQQHHNYKTKQVREGAEDDVHFWIG